MMEECFAYDDVLRRGGHFLGGEADASGHNVSMWSPPVAVRQRDPHQGVD
jgi:hypothetical protein